MTCTTASRLLAGHNSDDDAEALLVERPAPTAWALKALADETASCIYAAVQLHDARGHAPAGALDEDIVQHCAAILHGASEICERLLRALPDVDLSEITSHARH